MKPIDFKIREKVSEKANKVYLHIDYAGGDADTEHPETHYLGIPFDTYHEHLAVMNSVSEQYNQLAEILGSDHTLDYNQVREMYGDVMAHLYDQVPNDPQSDYQFKCYIDTIYFIGYDKEGNEYTASI